MTSSKPRCAPTCSRTNVVGPWASPGARTAPRAAAHGRPRAGVARRSPARAAARCRAAARPPPTPLDRRRYRARRAGARPPARARTCPYHSPPRSGATARPQGRQAWRAPRRHRGWKKYVVSASSKQASPRNGQTGPPESGASSPVADGKGSDNPPMIARSSTGRTGRGTRRPVVPGSAAQRRAPPAITAAVRFGSKSLAASSS
jgi:hypothetical protein